MMIRGKYRRPPRPSLLSILHSSLYRLAQRFMTLDVTRVVWLDGDAVCLPDSTDSRFVFRFLSPADIRRFSNERSNGFDDSHAECIALGRDFCFAALDGGRLAAYAWFALGSIEAANNRGQQENSGVAVSVPKDVAFMYKGFTHPDYRGVGLYGRINGLALVGLGVHGVRSLLSTMDWSNWAAFRSCRKLGFVQLGRLWRWGWGERMHTNAPKNAKVLGIQFGDQIAQIFTPCGEARSSAGPSLRAFPSTSALAERAEPADTSHNG